MENYVYYAFISYKREDEKWAKWLQQKLENYKLPATVRKEIPRLPKRVRPIFRDMTDLGGGMLVDNIKNELHSSRYLIVICSPHSAQSEWVSKEVQDFIDHDRLGDIIPFIVGGDPKAADLRENCFPSALRNLPAEKELLGINVNEIGKEQACIKVIAQMLGIRFDALWRRYERARRIRKYWMAAACAFLLLLCGLYFEYNRTRYEYYAGYVDRWGVPEGVVPLPTEVVAHRNSLYRFEYRHTPIGEGNPLDWRLTRVVNVNSAGTVINRARLMNTIDYYPILAVEYKNGEVSALVFSDEWGRVRLRHTLSYRDGKPACVVDLWSPKVQEGVVVGSDPNVTRYVYERDALGYIVRTTYHANNDMNIRRSMVRNEEGVFGYQFELDSLHRPIKIFGLDMDGSVLTERSGIVGAICEYGAEGEILWFKFFDQGGLPVLDNELERASVQRRFDEYGNVTEECNYGIDGKLCYNAEGYAKCVFEYDERGNQIRQVYYGTDGKPCWCNGGFAGIACSYDEFGLCVRIEYFGIDGKPCINKIGCAKWTQEYDDKGYCVEIVSYGKNGQLCLTNTGYARETSCYDEQGNVIEVSYFGTTGKPCISLKQGCARWTASYDDRGNMITVEHYGVDNRPCYGTEGYFLKTCSFDERGNPTEEAYYGINGKPCIVNSCSKIRCDYDEAGNCIEIDYYGIDGKPCFGEDGYAKVERTHDEKGRCVIEAYYDTKGQPCRTNSGDAKCVNSYDAQSRREKYYDVDGSPALCNGRYASIFVTFNERGDITGKYYYDKEGRPCIGDFGVAKEVFLYDAKGNVIESAGYGVDSAPALMFLKNGSFHKRTYTYNERGWMIEEATYDTDDNLCLGENWYAMQRYKYNERGNLIESSFYGTDGKPALIAKMKYVYDERGYCVELTIYGTDGKPLHLDNGLTTQKFEHDERGNRMRESYFDEKGAPCLYNGLYASVAYEYDERGNNIERSYYGVDGKPCVREDSVACEKISYNEYGKFIQKLYYDVDGNPCKNKYGVHKIVQSYDERGEVDKTRFFDEEGREFGETE